MVPIQAQSSEPHHVDTLTKVVGPKWSSLLKGWALGLLAAALLFIAIVGFVTLIQTHSVLNDVKNSQSNHTQTLKEIQRVWENDYEACVKLIGPTDCYPPPPSK